MFHSFHGLINSINWPASSAWVFLAQLVEHCSANAEPTGSNPVEAPKKLFFGLLRNCSNCDSTAMSNVHFNVTTSHNHSASCTQIKPAICAQSPPKFCTDFVTALHKTAQRAFDSVVCWRQSTSLNQEEIFHV